MLKLSIVEANEFKNKVIIVTGSSRGIGKEIALNLANKGAVVVINYLKSQKEAEKIVKQINTVGIGKSIAIKADISKKQKVKRMCDLVINKFGRIDILINNAGAVFENNDWTKHNNKDWDRTIAVNLTGVFNCILSVSPIMIKQKFGKILNISSLRSFLGARDIVAYSAAKAGVNNLTKSYAKILSPYVNVNSIALGMISIGMNKNIDIKSIKKFASKNLVGRVGKKEDVFNAVEFLISSRSDFITGQTLIVDGGAILAG